MISVPRLSSRAEMPMTAIINAAARPTTTILRWVVRFAVYSDQFMPLTRSPQTLQAHCLSGQFTYTKVQHAALGALTRRSKDSPVKEPSQSLEGAVPSA